MKEKRLKRVIKLGLGFLLIFLFGCSSIGGRDGVFSELRTPQKEADWIIEGKPIEYEGELWYPQDNVDILVDSELSLLGEYNGVQIFAEKVDVKPYDRLYTKFGR